MGCEVNVLLSGLIALVPILDETGQVKQLTALVLRAGEGTYSSLSTAIPAHGLSASFGVKSSGEQPPEHLGGYHLHFNLPGAPRLDLTPGNTPNLSTLSQGQSLAVNRACLSAECKANCSLESGLHRVQTWITFSGPWTADLPSEPPKNHVTSKYTFLSINDKGTATLEGEPVELPGTVRLRGQVDSCDLLSVTWSEGEDQKSWSPKGQTGPCTKDGTAQHCYSLELTNHPASIQQDTHSGHGDDDPSTVNLGSEWACRLQFDRSWVDTHFDLYYDLLEKPPAIRKLPLQTWRDEKAVAKLCDPGAGGRPPRTQCSVAMLPAVSSRSSR
jgi:hypothetical protein